MQVLTLRTPENYELEYRQNSNNNCALLVFSFYQENSIDCAEIKNFQFAHPSIDQTLSDDTLMEQAKPRVGEKLEQE